MSEVALGTRRESKTSAERGKGTELGDAPIGGQAAHGLGEGSGLEIALQIGLDGGEVRASRSATMAR